jgi:hypothetical protein
MKHLPTLILLACLAPAFGQKLTSTTVPNPSAEGSLQPNWSVAPDGAAILSWIEPSKGGSFSLRYAVRRGDTWSPARTVAAGRHFFRHPAESPEVIAVSNRLWMAHWVEMPDESSEAEFLYVSSSVDGIKWSVPKIAHRDRSPVEHGLASIVGSGPAEASILWLELLKGEDGPGYLMRTVVNAAGVRIKEEQLDLDVCTCCPTAVAKTAKGLLVAYRDHTPADIRDISVIRFENGRWTQPKTLYADNWKINACPVNAASVSAKGDHAVVAWYTGAQESPRVQAVFSEDSGATFGKPVTISTGHAFGFTSAILADDRTSTISWLERGPKGDAKVLVRQVSSTGTAGPTLQVAEGGQMGLGYPRLVLNSAGALIVWSAPGMKLQTAALSK